MKFLRIIIPQEITQTKGIERIDIQRLSDVVAFVGKNGSGKTRIIDLIEDNILSNVTPLNINSGTISYLPKNLLTSIENPRIKILQDRIKACEEAGSQNKGKLRFLRDQLSQIVSAEPISILKSKYIKRIRNSDTQQLLVEIPKNQEITFESLMERVAENVVYDEMGLIRESSIKYLKDLTNELIDDEDDCNWNKKEFEKRKSYKRYMSLKTFISDLLRKDLTWVRKRINRFTTIDGLYSTTYSTHWALNGREFNYAELSEGERVLFSYALLFFLLNQNPNLNIRESIILIDEPELHLHPDSEIDLIEGIRRVVKDKGQLIIATHSINILSMLSYDEIFMVKDGKITSPSQATPGQSLSELMGIEQRVKKMSDFLSDISTWSFVNFVVQCFSDPEVIANANPNDPGIIAFIKAIKDNVSEKTNILLDFGAGKGRVYQQIKSENDFLNSIIYCALEPNKEFHSTLEKLGASKIYTRHTELKANNFDFVLLCNVLHEIPFEGWQESLNAIIESLKPNGYLIILEPKYLNKGEKIGKIGYLLLDKKEIQLLFNLPFLPTSITVDGKEDTMTCVAINKSDLQRISQANIKLALEALENNTLNKIENIREKEHSPHNLYDIGRKMAFLSQQHINAKIALKHLKERESAEQFEK